MAMHYHIEIRPKTLYFEKAGRDFARDLHGEEELVYLPHRRRNNPAAKE